MKTRALLGMIVLLILLGGCGEAKAPPRVASTPPVIFTHTPPAAVSSPLLGTYTTTITVSDGTPIAGFQELVVPDGRASIGLGEWKLTFRGDGYFTTMTTHTYASSAYVSFGQYRASGNHVIIDIDAKCHEFYGPEGETATYLWTLTGPKLTLKAVGDDVCGARNIIFSHHPWLRQ